MANEFEVTCNESARAYAQKKTDIVYQAEGQHVRISPGAITHIDTGLDITTGKDVLIYVMPTEELIELGVTIAGGAFAIPPKHKGRVKLPLQNTSSFVATLDRGVPLATMFILQAIPATYKADKKAETKAA